MIISSHWEQHTKRHNEGCTKGAVQVFKPNCQAKEQLINTEMYFWQEDPFDKAECSHSQVVLWMWFLEDSCWQEKLLNF